MKTILDRLVCIVLLPTAITIVSCNREAKNNNGTKEFISSRKMTNDNTGTILYKSQNLVIKKISPHVYRHISYLNTNDFGKVECNGMLVVNGGKAVIFDTPADDSGSEELIHYVNQDLNSIITAVIPTHFHNDCVGGLKAFGQHHIPAYAFSKTIDLMKKEGNKNASLLKSFNDSLTLEIAGEKVYARFFGEGHTKDNIVGYFPEDSILFGGCLIKELKGSKGFLGDANVKEWSATVLKVKQKFPQAKVVIPGHGKPGGTSLLDYTAALFKADK